MGTIRLFLALAVLGWHMRTAGYPRLTTLDGGIAVIAFFIISGFYMSMIVSQKYNRLPNGRRRFFTNRFLRIFPLYFVAMILQQLVFSLDGVKTVFTSSLKQTGLTHVMLVLMNLFKFGQDYWQTLVEVFSTSQVVGITSSLEKFCTAMFGAKAFQPHPGALLVGQGWSLASELTYYLIAPFVVSMAWYKSCGLGAASVLIRIFFLLEWGGAFMGSWRAKFFPAILVFFILGHFAFLAYEKIKTAPHRKTGARLFAAAWLMVIIYSYYNSGFLLEQEYDGWKNWCFYMFVTLSIPYLFSLTQDSKLDNFIGEFSYPVYLVHPAIMQLALHHVHVPAALHYLNIVIGTLALSYALLLLVDRPINKVRARIGSASG